VTASSAVGWYFFTAAIASSMCCRPQMKPLSDGGTKAPMRSGSLLSMSWWTMMPGRAHTACQVEPYYARCANRAAAFLLAARPLRAAKITNFLSCALQSGPYLWLQKVILAI
jgi:hypothetical protein